MKKVDIQKCSKCDKVATDSNCSRRQGNESHRFRSWCKACTAIHDRERRLRNVEVWKEYIFSTIGCSCKRCGFDIWEALEFHHIEPRNGNQELAIGNRMHVYSPYTKKGAWLREEIKKCELVCANCHRLIHAKII